MATLSPRAERAVRDFAESAGLSATPAADGSFSFRFVAGDLLTFTPAITGDRMVVSLAFAVPGLVESDLERVLAVASLDPATDRAIHAGRSRDGTIVLAVAVDGEGADLPVIDAVLGQLRGMRRAVA